MPKDARLNSNKREHQKITLKYSTDIDFEDFNRVCKKCTTEPYSFKINDATLASDNPSKFRKIFLNKYIIKSCKLMIRLEVKNYNMVLIEKLQKHQTCYHAKLRRINILLVKNITI